jgi:hypothetical protein
MVIDRYEREEMPNRYSTKSGYKPCLKNHIRPKWGSCLVEVVPETYRHLCVNPSINIAGLLGWVMGIENIRTLETKHLTGNGWHSKERTVSHWSS